MKKMILGVVLLMVLPAACFAQSNPPAPSSWVDFQKEQQAKMSAFFAQMRADREAFLSSHPDAKAYLEEVNTAAKERLAAWKASHQQKL